MSNNAPQWPASNQSSSSDPGQQPWGGQQQPSGGQQPWTGQQQQPWTGQPWNSQPWNSQPWNGQQQWPGSASGPGVQPGYSPPGGPNAATTSGNGPDGQDRPYGQTGLGAPTHDPRAPMSGYVPAAVDIEQFTQKRSNRPLLITIGVLVVVAIAVLVGVHAMDRPVATPTTSASPVASATSDNPLSVPFDNSYDDAQGTWTITKVQWTGETLLLTMQISVTQGTQAMGFFAISNDADTQSYEAKVSNRSDDLLGREVSAGQTATGTVMFSMPDKESTIFITDSHDRQVTALVVPA